MYQDEHTIAEINEITNSIANAKMGYKFKTPDKDLQNKINKNYTFWGNCWKCVKFVHSANECQNNLTMTNQDQTHNGPANIQTTELI